MDRPRAAYSPAPELKVRLQRAYERFGYTPEQMDRELREMMQIHSQERRLSKERARLARETELADQAAEEVSQESGEIIEDDLGHDTVQEQMLQPTDENTPAGDQDSLFVPETTNSARREDELPPWYVDIRRDSYTMKLLTRTKNEAIRQPLSALLSLKDCIDRCEKDVVRRNPATLARCFEELRDHLHKFETLKVNEFMLKKYFILENGLTRIFASKAGLDFPWDLCADARQLFHRWCNKDFSADLLRGIVLATWKDKADKRSADSLDPKWPYRVSARYYGEGDLVLGQWWPTQLCTVRDGAHGSAQGGIYGEKGMGAYSVVISGGNQYADEDHGTWLWYTGTEGKDYTPTENTMRMMESCELKRPVRVIRSHNLDKKNIYRPEGGFRYDGLYDVVAKEMLVNRSVHYRFRLVRRAHQFPIRCGDNAARRPTRFELQEYRKLREQGKISALFA